MSKTFNIRLDGCDDSTLVEFELTPMQAALLSDLAAVVNKAARGVTCMPKLIVWRVGEQDPDPYAGEDFGENESA